MSWGLRKCATASAILKWGQMIALGTMDELRNQAKITDSRLETLFLKLTEEGM
jgi:hypothetical protein